MSPPDVRALTVGEGKNEERFQVPLSAPAPRGAFYFLPQPFHFHRPRRRRARPRPQPAQPTHSLAARLHDLPAPALQRALRLGRPVAQPLLAARRTEQQPSLEGRERLCREQVESWKTGPILDHV